MGNAYLVYLLQGRVHSVFSVFGGWRVEYTVSVYFVYLFQGQIHSVFGVFASVHVCISHLGIPRIKSFFLPLWRTSCGCLTTRSSWTAARGRVCNIEVCHSHAALQIAAIAAQLEPLYVRTRPTRVCCVHVLAGRCFCSGDCSPFHACAT